MVQSTQNYVEVFIWRARDYDGYVTTSSEGARLEKSGNPGKGRVGHAALNILQNDTSKYISLWPDLKEKVILIENFKQEREGCNPDVIIRLKHLNIPAMIKHYELAKARVQKKELTWDWHVHAESSPFLEDPRVSCVSFVWWLLKEGGIRERSGYGENLSDQGPSDPHFYKLLKCNLGQTLWGWFDGFWWTTEFFTPYALSLRVGSAAERYSDDIEETKKIMLDKARVTETKERLWGWGSYVSAAGVGALAVFTAKKLVQK